MLFGNVFAIFGAAPSVALVLLSFLYAIASVCVYLSLIYQISTRIRSASGTEMPVRSFGLPEAVLASALAVAGALIAAEPREERLDLVEERGRRRSAGHPGEEEGQGGDPQQHDARHA